VSLATIALTATKSNEGTDIGPTAASVDEAFGTLLGAAAGLFIGTGLAAALARRGPRLVTGIVAGFVAYACVLVPILIITRPSDVDFGESLGIALTGGVPLGLAVLLGASSGSAVGRLWRRRSP
jgi:hypothetical protein